jgi:hypothetical protein
VFIRIDDKKKSKKVKKKGRGRYMPVCRLTEREKERKRERKRERGDRDLQRAAWKRTQNLFFVEDTRY